MIIQIQKFIEKLKFKKPSDDKSKDSKVSNNTTDKNEASRKVAGESAAKGFGFFLPKKPDDKSYKNAAVKKGAAEQLTSELFIAQLQKQRIEKERELMLEHLNIQGGEPTKEEVKKEGHLASGLAERLIAEFEARKALNKEKEEVLLREQDIIKKRESMLSRLNLIEAEVNKIKEQDMTEQRRLSAQFSENTSRVVVGDELAKQEPIVEKEQISDTLEKQIMSGNITETIINREKDEELLREQKVASKRDETLERLRSIESTIAKTKGDAVEKERLLSEQFSAQAAARQAIDKEKADALLREQEIAKEKQEALERRNAVELEIVKADDNNEQLYAKFAEEVKTRLTAEKEKEEALRRLHIAESEIVKNKEEAANKQKQLLEQFATQVMGKVTVEKEEAFLREQKIAREKEEVLQRLRIAEAEIAKIKEDVSNKKELLSERFATQVAERIITEKEKEGALKGDIKPVDVKPVKAKPETPTQSAALNQIAKRQPEVKETIRTKTIVKKIINNIHHIPKYNQHDNFRVGYVPYSDTAPAKKPIAPTAPTASRPAMAPPMRPNIFFQGAKPTVNPVAQSPVVNLPKQPTPTAREQSPHTQTNAAPNLTPKPALVQTPASKPSRPSWFANLRNRKKK
jgi:hypothetical protein